MYGRCKHKVVCNFSLALLTVLIVWVSFLKYTYHSSGLSILPESWKLSDSCYVKDNDDSIELWSTQLRRLTYIHNPQPYNIPNSSCTSRFYFDFESNIRKILRSQIVRNCPCVYYNASLIDTFAPVIVTAASSNHFNEVQGLFRSIHQHLVPLYRNLKVIFYDIGLSPNENIAMRKHCKCEVRIFPFHKFPPHVSILGGFAWKPVILFEVLNQYKFVMWLDTSIRFLKSVMKNELDFIFKRTKDVGIQLQESPRWIVSNHTKPDTYKFLEEKECLFNYPELEGGWLLFWNKPFSFNAILRPWIGCALTEHCMTHPYPARLKPCSKDLWKFLLWTRCHRFDQSVLNIILIRIFNQYRKLIEFDGSRIASISRNDYSNYFSLLP